MKTSVFPAEKQAAHETQLSQYQNYVGFKFAFGTKIKPDTVAQSHVAVRCRDYLSDVVDYDWWGSERFTGTGTLDKDKCRLLIFSPQKNNSKALPKNLPLLLRLEEQAKLIPTTVTESESHPGVFIVEGDPIWKNNSIGFSLYSMLLRICGVPRALCPVDWQKQLMDETGQELLHRWGAKYDGYYINPYHVDITHKLLNNIGEVVRVREDLFGGYPKKEMHYTHGNIGFSSLQSQIEYAKQQHSKVKNPVFAAVIKVIK